MHTPGAVPTPVAVTLQEEPPTDNELPQYAAKIKVRYFVEKDLGGQWVLMARVPGDCESLENLCFAIGGLVRVTDVTTHRIVIEREF